MRVTKSPLKLYANLKAVIALFLELSPERNKFIFDRVNQLSEEEIKTTLLKVKKDYASRHRDLDQIFSDHFLRIGERFHREVINFSRERKLLMGAYFTKEYSIQAAALFNPSIVAHPDQNNVKPGELRFIMSLRATGEGHISSVCFRTGMIDREGSVTLDEMPQYYTRLNKSKLMHGDPSTITPSSYDIEDSSVLPLNEKVLFPYSKAESMGMEDVRFVQFNDGDHSCYYGTYTAYNGIEINTQLIETPDFNIFKIRTLGGAAISDKGMALFPEKINGQYVMTSRQGAEKLSIMFSEDLYHWETYKHLLAPRFPWELVQIGNCGSPIKTEKGWLLLTHGVGAVRTYVISAILLDLNDPSKIIGSLDMPFLSADEDEREGYVPNVVYTCGFIRHEDHIVIPYAVSDYSICFATILVSEILDDMKP